MILLRLIDCSSHQRNISLVAAENPDGKHKGAQKLYAEALGHSSSELVSFKEYKVP